MTVKTPAIEFIPLRDAIAKDQTTNLDLLIKIVPPTIEISGDRPPLNLGLVIDRSGSMHGRKIQYARQAAIYAVEQLLPSDRISVVAFDSYVKTLVNNTLANQKDPIIRSIKSLHPGSSTALHAGWVEGGIQVGHQLNSDWLNRVLLLSDGLANVGETNPDAIATDVNGLTQRGISTSTMGIGNDYNEDLMAAMAQSGDGNFYHIESPDQLPDFFQTELQGLMATTGHTVSLGINPVNETIVTDILNNLGKTNTGRLKLPNLVSGNPIYIVVRLRIPPQQSPQSLCQVRLAWTDPEVDGRQVLHAALKLPVVDASQLDEFPPNPEVQQKVALLMSARAQEEAIQYIDRGQFDQAGQRLRVARAAVCAAPMSPELMEEQVSLDALDTNLSSGEVKEFRKSARYHSHARHHSRSVAPKKPPEQSK